MASSVKLSISRGMLFTKVAKRRLQGAPGKTHAAGGGRWGNAGRRVGRVGSGLGSNWNRRPRSTAPTRSANAKNFASTRQWRRWPIFGVLAY